METTQHRAPTLVRLGDTTMTVADPEEDVRGRKAVDADGEEIGTVADLLVDHDEERVRFLEVGAGGFLGLGETKFLVPADAVTRVDAEMVHLGPTRAQVLGAPQYDPDVVPEPDWGAVYDYYGMAPFWGPAPMVPPFR